MKKGNDRDKVAEKMGYVFNAKPKKEKRESKTKKIKGDPQSLGKLEKEIEKEIFDYLFQKKIEYFPLKIKGELQSVGNGRVIVKASQNCGFPDILCCIKGLFVGVEVKKPSGVQSEKQIAMERRIVSAKGYYFIVTSVRELESFLSINNLI